MFGKKKPDQEKSTQKSDLKDYLKWEGQWDRREESKKKMEEEKKTSGVKRVEGLTETEIEQLSYDFVRIFLTSGYNLEKVPESSYGGKFKGDRLIANFNSLDRLIIFINFFPKQGISDAIGRLTKEQRNKISKKLSNPPPMSNEERAAIWNVFLQRYYFDELEKMKTQQEKGGWFKSLTDWLKR